MATAAREKFSSQASPDVLTALRYDSRVMSVSIPAAYPKVTLLHTSFTEPGV